MKNITLSAELRPAVFFKAHYDRFGSHEEWRKMYFRVLERKNTLSSWFYKVDLLSLYDGVPYIKIVAPKEHTESIREMLETIGYQDIAWEEGDVAVIDPYGTKEFFYDTFCEW